MIVDQHGHYWRDYGDYLSMCPVSTENVKTVAEAVYVLFPGGLDAVQSVVWTMPPSHVPQSPRRIGTTVGDARLTEKQP